MSTAEQAGQAEELRAAVLVGDVAAAEALLIAGAPPGVQDAEGRAPLHHAAAAGNLDLAALLLEYGADLSGGSTGEEWRPLVHAAYNGHSAMVQLLVASGADVTRSGGQPLHFAGQRGHQEICRILVDAGAVEELMDPTVATPEVLEVFQYAYSFQADKLTPLLRSRPELARARDVEGRTPMHEAATNGDVEVVQALLRAGGEMDARSERGQTPLDRAMQHGKAAVARVLVDAGAATDLFTACRFGAAQRVVRLLSEQPELRDARNATGHSPLDVARLYCQKAIVRLLLERGAADPEELGRRFLQGAVLSHGDRRGTLVQVTNIRGAAFDEADLAHATFNNVSLAHATFNNVNLSHAVYQDINLSGSLFWDLNLSNSTFRDANLTGARLEHVLLTGFTIDGIEVLPLLEAEKQRRAAAEEPQEAERDEGGTEP
jgi:ankyrin repeat protein